MSDKNKIELHWMFIFGICLVAVGVIFTASLSKAGLFPVGITFLIIGTVFLILGILKTKKMES
jgi:hypothetical protein